MPLDLRRLRPRLEERILVDLCNIYRDVEANTDDVTDPVTGEVTNPSPDEITLGTNVPALARHVLRDVMRVEGGIPNTLSEYDVLIPGGIYTVGAGDWLRWVASVHDPLLVGKFLRVEEVRHGTLSIFTSLRCEIRERQRDRL